MLDVTFKGIRRSDTRMGSTNMLLAWDFRRTLKIIPQGNMKYQTMVFPIAVLVSDWTARDVTKKCLKESFDELD
ncbi:hypothetical protein AVEN_90480-1 [Araneus ventricosus]|uniref:Uncharacterized protein n=1 Tax=Araneus ventricosus TaxID=182803 RepID=A0A4Y2X6D3_ARAVE|nr:hypothetical protein AVEN_90480-1 [Araneus ventricosus]